MFGQQLSPSPHEEAVRSATPSHAPRRPYIPILLCAGMAVIPLVALAGGGPPDGAAPPPAHRHAVVAVQTASAAPLAVAGTVPSTVMTSSTTSPPAATGTVPQAAPVSHAARAAVRVDAYRAPAGVTHRAVAGAAPRPTTTVPRPSQTGPASWYGAEPGTCAHKTLPFGTVVTIVNLSTGATATCTVDDRGPYEGARIIDLAPDVFAKLAPTSIGVIDVRISW